MAKSSDLEKTWKPGPATTTTFNTPGSLSIPYGRYRGIISGRGASGNAPNAATYNTNYNTNYNTAYPVGTQPIAAQPAATWNTNYNVTYPVASQPIANQPVNAWNTNYYTSYPLDGFSPGNPFSTGTYNAPSITTYVVRYVECTNPQGDEYQTQTFNYWNNTGETYESPSTDSQCPYSIYGYQYYLSRYAFYDSQDGCTTYSQGIEQCFFGCCAWNGNYDGYAQGGHQASSQYYTASGTSGNLIYGFNYNANYYVDYPIGSQPASAWSTNYNTNYNTAYPIANRPAATWNTNYNTNYNVAYPIANQPIANQPAATYNVANAGAPATILGVSFPGGTASAIIGTPNPAPPVANTLISYWSIPDNSTQPITVPSGGQVIVRLE